jgi:O-succinylbenzoic acid--CoA ligase
MNLLWKNIAEDSQYWRNLPNDHEITFFSSGSTGAPKEVIHTKATLEASARGTIEFYQLKNIHRWGLTLPLNHVSGAMVLVRSILLDAPAPLIKGDRDLENFIVYEKFSCLSLVSTQLYRLLEKPSAALIKRLQSMKVILLGGGSFSPDLLAKCAELNLPVSLTYGMTEMASQIFATKIGDVLGYRHILPGRKMKVVDHEIFVGGSSLAINTYTDQDGFYATGDCGEITEDRGLIILGRKDQMIISGGENIFPDHIENVFKMIPAVADAVIVGKNDPEWGQAVCALLRVTDHVFMPDIKKAKTKLKSYECPKHFYLLNNDQWQKLLVNFKVSRIKAKEYATNNSPSVIR